MSDSSWEQPKGSLYNSYYTIGEGTTPRIALFTLYLYLIMLCVKQRGINHHFLNLWYDSTWDWTPVSRTIGKHMHLFYFKPKHLNTNMYTHIHVCKSNHETIHIKSCTQTHTNICCICAHIQTFWVCTMLWIIAYKLD